MAGEPGGAAQRPASRRAGRAFDAPPAPPLPEQVARGVIGLMVTGHYPLAFVPARVAFVDLLSTLANVSDVPYWVTTTFTVLFFLMSLAIAMVVSTPRGTTACAPESTQGPHGWGLAPCCSTMMRASAASAHRMGPRRGVPRAPQSLLACRPGRRAPLRRTAAPVALPPPRVPSR